MSSTHVAVSRARSTFPQVQPPSATVKELVNALFRAIEKAKRGLGFAQEMDEAGLLLASLPLTTEEFGLASNRLRNANRYVMSGEFGAATWELGTLRKVLSRQD
jgi:hypothetical protein